MTTRLTSANNLLEVATATDAVRIIANGTAKAGTTAGWVVNAADNLGKLATLPKAITGGTLVVRLPNLKVGDKIVGAYAIGSLQASTGHATTFLLDIRSSTAAAAGSTDARVVVMGATLSVEANTVLSESNTSMPVFQHTVAEGETFYALITATTADDNSCTAGLLGVVLQVIPA